MAAGKLKIFQTETYKFTVDIGNQYRKIVPQLLEKYKLKNENKLIEALFDSALDEELQPKIMKLIVERKPARKKPEPYKYMKIEKGKAKAL